MRIVAKWLVVRMAAATEVNRPIFVGFSSLRNNVAARPVQVEWSGNHVRPVGRRRDAKIGHIFRPLCCYSVRRIPRGNLTYNANTSQHIAYNFWYNRAEASIGYAKPGKATGMAATIRLKRAYEKPARGDGFRILVDRLWPRGIRKEDLHLGAWAKALAPSTELRKWFAHDPDKWSEFCKRYRLELRRSQAAGTVGELLAAAKRAKAITLLYGAKDREHNEAVVLRDLFERVAENQADR
jgi:uncharacterized protein YeaO (DUF488 family)